VLKVIDFGFAKFAKKDRKELDDFIGTPYYIAPEIIDNKKYGCACDIWSLGVLTYYIVEGGFPFTANNK
jgi:serine/threonine protein kinase